MCPRSPVMPRASSSSARASTWPPASDWRSPSGSRTVSASGSIRESLTPRTGARDRPERTRRHRRRNDGNRTCLAQWDRRRPPAQRKYVRTAARGHAQDQRDQRQSRAGGRRTGTGSATPLGSQATEASRQEARTRPYTVGRIAGTAAKSRDMDVTVDLRSHPAEGVDARIPNHGHPGPRRATGNPSVARYPECNVTHHRVAGRIHPPVDPPARGRTGRRRRRAGGRTSPAAPRPVRRRAVARSAPTPSSLSSPNAGRLSRPALPPGVQVLDPFEWPVHVDLRRVRVCGRGRDGHREQPVRDDRPGHDRPPDVRQAKTCSTSRTVTVSASDTRPAPSPPAPPDRPRSRAAAPRRRRSTSSSPTSPGR